MSKKKKEPKTQLKYFMPAGPERTKLCELLDISGRNIRNLDVKIVYGQLLRVEREVSHNVTLWKDNVIKYKWDPKGNAWLEWAERKLKDITKMKERFAIICGEELEKESWIDRVHFH